MSTSDVCVWVLHALDKDWVAVGEAPRVRWLCARCRVSVSRIELHVNAAGHGAVGDIIAGGPAAAHMLLSAGADGTVRVLDPRMGFGLAATASLTNFPYCLGAAGGVAIVGCGDGSLHFLDIKVRASREGAGCP